MSETRITWHKFPDETPPIKNTTYLVTQKIQSEETGIRVTTARWFVRTWQAVDILAWAHLPEPYEDGDFKLDGARPIMASVTLKTMQGVIDALEFSLDHGEFESNIEHDLLEQLLSECRQAAIEAQIKRTDA